MKRSYPGRWKDLLLLLAACFADSGKEWIQVMIIEKDRQWQKLRNREELESLWRR